MKHRILVAAASLVLAALILLLLPSAHPSQGVPDASTSPTTPTAPDDPTVVPTTGTTPEYSGVVRLYSCDDGFLAVFTELATEYTALTGVEVVVLRPEDGCQETLKRYMESEDPPTVLCVHNQRQLKQWSNTLLDLEDTALAAALCNDGLGLRLNGKLLGVPAAVEGYGLLANAELLATGAYTCGEITNFSILTEVVQNLKNNSIKAFPTATFTMRDAWYLLMGEELQSTRDFIDLYLTNCSTSGDPMSLFLNEKSAFYLSGTWDYDALASSAGTALEVINLDILPNFSAGVMQYICSTAWCVNAGARQEDIDATLAFMTWMVTAGEEAAAPVDRLEVLSPFADARWYGNQLQKKLRSYMLTEAAAIQWDGGEMGTDPLLMALNSYLAERTDENWEQLCLTVEQFRAEYAYQ